MAAEQISGRPLKLYVHGYCIVDRKELWYCIDLEDLSETMTETDEQVLPILVFCVNSMGGGWTVVGDHIYWAGKSEDDDRFAPMVLGRHNINTSTDPFSLDVLCVNERRLPFRPPLINMDGHRILLLDLKVVIYSEEDEEYDDSFMGEVYDLDTGITHEWAFNLMNFTAGFQSTLLMDVEAKVKQVIFYSLHMGSLLFYDVSKDKFRLQNHPKLVLYEGLYPECGGSSIDMLSHLSQNVNAVVMDSTLYWFTQELCLYGYDFIQRTWFHSPPLKAEQLWKLPREPLGFPFLVDSYNRKELVLLLRTPSSKLGIALLAVSKRGKSSLDVIVKSRRNLYVDPDFLPCDGIAMTVSVEVPQRMSGATLKTARKLKTPGTDADSVSSPNPANRIPKDRSPEVVCLSSQRSSVIELDSEAELVDISDESKGQSVYVEQILPVSMDVGLATQLNESESISGFRTANLVDKDIELQSLLEENEWLKLKVTQVEKASEIWKLEMKAAVERAKIGEREAMTKLRNLTVEADNSRKMVACVIAELNAAKAANLEVAANSEFAANSEIETELRRLKVQCDQWRKAAEAAVSLLSTGNNKKNYNL